jgi:hypothetical protein
MLVDSGDASANVVSHIAGPFASSGRPVATSVERVLVPSAATSGNDTKKQGTDALQAFDVEDGDQSDEEEETTWTGKRKKKFTSDVGQYFDIYWVIEEVDGKVESQHWTKCNFKGCHNKTSKGRCESRFATTGL